MNEFDPCVAAPRKARVEIIPLIDVIFFLLATFVLFTLSLNRTFLIDTPLPIPGEGKSDDTLFIQASEEGTYFWKKGSNGAAELISRMEISPRLEQYKRSVAVPRVFIRSDRRAKMRDAVAVLDAVRLAGIKQVSI